jgi:hypothetical protein
MRHARSTPAMALAMVFARAMRCGFLGMAWALALLSVSCADDPRASSGATTGWLTEGNVGTAAACATYTGQLTFDITDGSGKQVDMSTVRSLGFVADRYVVGGAAVSTSGAEQAQADGSCTVSSGGSFSCSLTQCGGEWSHITLRGGFEATVSGTGELVQCAASIRSPKDTTSGIALRCATFAVPAPDLSTGHVLAGYVYARSEGTLARWAEVRVQRDANPTSPYSTCAFDALSGSYRCSALPAGNYRVELNSSAPIVGCTKLSDEQANLVLPLPADGDGFWDLTCRSPFETFLPIVAK